MPGEDRIDSFIDIPALKAEHDQLMKMLDELGLSIKKASNGEGLKNPSAGIKSLRTETQKAREETDKMGDSLKKVKSSTDDLEKAKIKLAASETKNAKEIAFTNSQTAENNKLLKIQAELENSVAGSIERSRARVKDLTYQRNILNITTEAGKKKQAELNAEINKENDFIKKNVDKLAQQKINVGNYEGSAKIIVDAFERAQQKVKQVNDRFGQTSPEAKAARHELEGLQRITENPQFLKISANFGDVTRESGYFRKELNNLQASGLGETKVAQDLRERLAFLGKEMEDTRKEIKLLASETKTFDAFASAVSFITSAFETAAGAAVLFGASGEDVEKSIRSLIAIQTFANGVQEIARQLTEKGTIANKVYSFIMGTNTKAINSNTVATEAQAVATETAAVATEGLSLGMKVLRGALIASGIGLLVAGVIYLVTKLQDWAHHDEELIKQQTALNETLLEELRLQREIADLVKTDIGTSTQNLKNKLAHSQAYGKSQGEILANELALLRAQQDLTTGDFFSTGGYRALDEYETQLNTVTQKYTDLIDAAAKHPEGTDKEDFELQKNLLKSQVDLARDRYSDQKKIVEDYVNNNIAINTKQLQIERLNADEARSYNLTVTKNKLQDTIDANNRLLANEKATQEQKLAAVRSTAAAERKIAQADFQNVKNDPSSSNKKIAEAANNLERILTKITKDSNVEREKINKEYRQRLRKAQLNILKLQIEDSAKAQDEIADNEKKGYSERLDAAYDAYLKRVQVIKALREEEIKAAEDSGQTEKEKAAIYQKYASEINQMTLEYTHKQVQIYKEGNDQAIIDQEDANSRRLLIIDKAQAMELLALEKGYGNGKISKINYEKEIAAIERRYRIISLKNEIDRLTGIVITTKQGSKERLEAESQKAKATLAINREVNNGQDEDNKNLWTKAQGYIETYGRSAINILGTVSTLSSINTDKEFARLDELQAANEKLKATELDRITNSTLSEQDKAAKIIQINAEAQVKQEAIDRRRKQLAIEQARFEKASNIANIISTTALAVVTTLADKTIVPGWLRIPLAATVGVLGAAQLAKAIATPLPKFAEGTDYSPEGLALVGEKGKELRIDPDGKMSYTPDHASLTWLDRGTKIIPHDELNKVMYAGMMSNMAMMIAGGKDDSVVQEIKGLKDTMVWHAGVITKAVQKVKPPKVVIYNNSDFQAHIQKSVFD